MYWFCYTLTWICHSLHVFPILKPHPPPSSSHPSGSSQCTSPEHPVPCIKPGLAIHWNVSFLQLFWGILSLTSSNFLNLCLGIIVFVIFILLELHWASEILNRLPTKFGKKKCWSLFLQISILFFLLLLQLQNYSILSNTWLVLFFQGFYFFFSILHFR